MHQRQGLVVWIICLLIASMTFAVSPVSAQGSWTVLVYLAGDNNLETYALGDLNEMEAVGSTSDVNIVVQIDRIDAVNLAAYGYPETSDDKSNWDWTGARRYRVARDSGLNDTLVSNLIANLGEVDMSDPNTLIDFVEWGMEKYPADHYAVILWDHGGGYTGLLWDFTSRKYMSMPELRGALATINYDTHKEIDVLGFDMCYMAMLEVDYQIAPYASARVASQENDPNDGWDYEAFLEGLINNPGMTGAQLSELVVSTFYDSHTDGLPDPNDRNFVTLSAVNLEGYSGLVSLADAFVNGIKTLDKASLTAAASDADFYGSEALGLSGRYRDFIDLYDFVSLTENYGSPQTSMKDAIKASVISEKHGTFHNPPGASGKSISGSNGISIYFPKDALDFLYAPNVRFGGDFHWVDLLLQINGIGAEEGYPLLIITSPTTITTSSKSIEVRGFTGADYFVNGQIFRNDVTVAGKPVSVNSLDGTFSSIVDLSCGVNSIRVLAQNEKGITTQTITATRTCASPTQPFLVVNLNATMQAPARFKVSQAQSLKKEAEALLEKAKSKNLPTKQIEETMKEAEELLKKAQGFLTGRNYIAANNFASKANDAYKTAIQVLKELLA